MPVAQDAVTGIIQDSADSKIAIERMPFLPAIYVIIHLGADRFVHFANLTFSPR